MKDGIGQNFANIAWGMAKLGHEFPIIAKVFDLDDVVNRFCRPTHFNDYTSTIWAMGKFKYDCSKLVNAFIHKADHVGSESTVSVSEAAVGLACLGYFNDVIFEKIATHANVSWDDS